MFSRRILLVIKNPGKKYAFIVIILLLISALLGTIIFANQPVNYLYNKSIVIDPGHGGIDGGTNDGSTFLEKNINLQIAKKLQHIMKEKNATVAMTRETDISLDARNNLSISRHARDLIARVEEFNTGKYDLFISLHVNSSTTSNAIGPMVLYSSEIPSTALLATCIQDRLNEHIRNNLKLETQHNPLLSQFFILKNANIPGVIIETGFISNVTEKKLLMDEAYQSKLVKLIYAGINDYYEKIDAVNSSKLGSIGTVLLLP